MLYVLTVDYTISLVFLKGVKPKSMSKGFTGCQYETKVKIMMKVLKLVFLGISVKNLRSLKNLTFKQQICNVIIKSMVKCSAIASEL